MLARQTRITISAQNAVALRALSRPSRVAIQPSTTSVISRRCVVTQQQRPWRRRGSEAGFGLGHERSLATAVDDFTLNTPMHDHLSGPGMPPFQSPSFRYHDIRSIDPSRPILIPEVTSVARTATKLNTSGIPGDVEDMLPVFDACIRVGKLDRAALVLKRMNTVGTVPGEERIYLHNQYLRANLEQMRTRADRKQAELLHKWYEMQIHNQDIPKTAETIACMLKASLLSERGTRLVRLVNRYMSMAPGEAGLRVLSMADILSDQDLAVITELCPTYNFVPDAEEPELTLAEEQEAIFQEGTETQTSSGALYPELVVTPQQGEGLTKLKESLNILSGLDGIEICKLPLQQQLDFQLRLERDSVDSAIERWREINKNLQKIGINTALNASSEPNSVASNLPEWLSGMEARLKVELAKIEESESKVSKSEEDLERCLYGPFIRQANPSRLAAVTILCVLNYGALMGIDRGIVLSKLIKDISRVAQEDLHLQEKDRLMKQARRQRRKVTYNGNKDLPTPDQQQTIIIDAHALPAEQEAAYPKPWSLTIKAQVGAILLKALVETAKVKVIKKHPVSKELISQYQPAFSHMQQPRKGKKVGVLVMNPQLVEKMKSEPIGDFLAKHLPMVVEPKPWSKMNKGGFLESKVSLVRVKSGDVEQKLYTKAAIKRGDMEQVFKGLDVLGRTAWRVNNEVLDVMVEAWNIGDEIANIPPLNPDLPLPVEPDSSADPLLRRAWIRTVKSIENERSGLHSQRCFMNLQLEIARAFRNQTIYFPHNVDYRGRAYPMPTYLNHMGADHTRSILKFAKGKELGASGLRWLKVHLANVYGFDKASFEEREAFATESLPNIIESATNPLKGSRWWLEAEDPWQCLAACFELKAAHELEDPTKFISQLPVHQDGTCNGLQHYAALGGDSWGARQVNLEPGNCPADVYSAVANLVKESIAKDAASDNAIAKAINGKITRKVVKQTVMTNVYGVTFAGAKKQVCKQIDALYPNLHQECGIPHILISTYIAKHIFTALASMFRGAHDIQYWLGECGGRVCRALTPAQLQQISDTYSDGAFDSTGAKKGRKSAKGSLDEFVQQFRSTVVWTTPLRMPVAQPYRKGTTKEIRTCLQSLAFPVSDQTDPVNRRKQLQGFPPNFIHSLDASHMLLSALQCSDLGLEFAAVHDSFWTHAADVDVMNSVLREAFIRIHEEDVVGRLAAEFDTRYKGSIYLAQIDADSPVAKRIKELRKNSKLSPKEELLLEYKRNTLKLSPHPWEQEAAKNIVTPAAVYEEMSAQEEDVAIRAETEEIGLGAIPEREADAGVADLVQEAQADIEDGIISDNGDLDDAAVQVSTVFTESLLENMKRSHFEGKIIEPRKTKATKSTKAPLAVWLPLTFPAIPKKGDFDVTRLRESKYFFS